jgi:putative transposase
VGVEAVSYKRFRYPVEIIAHCVWLYHWFPLSFREVQEMMLERGIIVSHETVRQWCAKFGQTYATGLRRRRARLGDTWHLDEVFIKIGGKTHYLWRAVDQDGSVQLAQWAAVWCSSVTRGCCRHPESVGAVSSEDFGS